MQRTHSQRRLERLAFLKSPQVQTLLQLPKEFLATYDVVSSLPPYDPSAASQLALPLVEPGKRPWETNKTGYMNWAVLQLVSRAKGGGQAAGGSAVSTVAEATSRVGKVEDIKALLELVSATPRPHTQDDDKMDES